MKVRFYLVFPDHPAWANRFLVIFHWVEPFCIWGHVRLDPVPLVSHDFDFGKICSWTAANNWSGNSQNSALSSEFRELQSIQALILGLLFLRGWRKFAGLGGAAILAISVTFGNFHFAFFTLSNFQTYSVLKMLWYLKLLPVISFEQNNRLIELT